MRFMHLSLTLLILTIYVSAQSNRSVTKQTERVTQRGKETPQLSRVKAERIGVVIEKKNGDRITGFFIGADQRVIEIEVSGARLKIPLDEVSLLRFTNRIAVLDKQYKDESPHVMTTRPVFSETPSVPKINDKPLNDLTRRVAEQWASNTIDLAGQFAVSLNLTLDRDGKIDPTRSKFDRTKERGSAQIVETAKEALEALAFAGYFIYLHSLGIDSLNVYFFQDDTKLGGVLTAVQKSPERARSTASGVNAYVMMSKLSVKADSDERTLLNGIRPAVVGNDFILNFEIPKPVAQEMISRKLKEVLSKQ